MKRYSLGLFSILLAISLAAFTNVRVPDKKNVDLYWFNVPGSINNTASLINSQVIYLNAHQPSDPSPGACAGGTKYCHVGFMASQVTVSGSTVTLNGSQNPPSYHSKP